MIVKGRGPIVQYMVPCLLALYGAGVAVTAQAAQQTQTAAWHRQFEQAAAQMRTGHFTEAIPLLGQLLAEGDTGYPVRFNLALCDVGTGDYAAAFIELHQLQKAGDDTAPMHNLLAQAYLGQGRRGPAWEQIQAAARMAPKDERMFALLMDACTSHDDYALGLRVASLGLAVLPGSARLHYGKALFLAQLDRLDEAHPEFALAAKLGAGTDIGALASVQSSLYDDEYASAAAMARAAIAAGHGSAEMQTLLGDVLLQGGAAPGEPAFEEARKVLEAAAAQRPQDATTQIALGSSVSAGKRLGAGDTASGGRASAGARQSGCLYEAGGCLPAAWQDCGSAGVHPKTGCTASVEASGSNETCPSSKRPATPGLRANVYNLVRIIYVGNQDLSRVASAKRLRSF